MKYTKPPTAFDQQVDLLVARGMQGDRDLMLRCLAKANYYRLSGYWHPMRAPAPDGSLTDAFRPGACFDVVWECRPMPHAQEARLLARACGRSVESTRAGRFVFDMIPLYALAREVSSVDR